MNTASTGTVAAPPATSAPGASTTGVPVGSATDPGGPPTMAPGSNTAVPQPTMGTPTSGPVDTTTPPNPTTVPTEGGAGGQGNPPVPTDTAPIDTTAPTATGTDMPPVDPPVVDEPSLIVSSEGNYWQVGEVTVVDAGTANFTVTTATQHQAWHGWGGTFNEAGWDALLELSEEDRNRAISLLFDDADGLNLDWGRIPIGPSDYALNRYTLSTGPGEFSIDRDTMHLIPFIKAAQGVKDDVKYWASPWTPPPWAKTDADAASGGYDKGFFNPEYFEEYADFFISWIQAYEAEGIPMDSVMPQNEPGWAQSYPTCAWGPARDSTLNMDIGTGTTRTLATFVDEHLYPKLDAAGLSTNVWFGTLSNNTMDPDHWNDMRAKASADRIIGVALQWECIAQVETVVDQGYLVMQSEHRCGNYPWGSSSGYVTHQTDQMPTDLAPNDFNYGQESWDLFVDWITRGVNIYSAWNMVLDTHGTNLDQVRVWNQNALLVVDRDTKELIVTPYYYVFRHLAQYVDNDAKRVEISGDALAFQNADGTVVAVMRTAAAGTQIVSIDGTLLQFDATGNGWVTVNYKPE